MEERLKKSKQGGGSTSSPRAQRSPLSNTFGSQVTADSDAASKRPGTAKQTQQAPVHGGALPPTPTASEGEYVLVNHSSSGDRGADSRNFTDYVLIPKDGGDREH